MNQKATVNDRILYDLHAAVNAVLQRHMKLEGVTTGDITPSQTTRIVQLTLELALQLGEVLEQNRG